MIGNCGQARFFAPPFLTKVLQEPFCWDTKAMFHLAPGTPWMFFPLRRNCRAAALKTSKTAATAKRSCIMTITAINLMPETATVNRQHGASRHRLGVSSSHEQRSSAESIQRQDRELCRTISENSTALCFVAICWPAAMNFGHKGHHDRSIEDSGLGLSRAAPVGTISQQCVF